MTLPIVTRAGRRAYPPRVTAFTRRFWERLDAGELETTVCVTCDRPSFPPKPICPHCWSTDVSWAPLSGRGTLYAQTSVHAAPAAFQHETPYHVAIVDLVEELRIALRLEAPAPLDGPVTLIVVRYDDGPLLAARGCDIAAQN